MVVVMVLGLRADEQLMVVVVDCLEELIIVLVDLLNELESEGAVGLLGLALSRLLLAASSTKVNHALTAASRSSSRCLGSLGKRTALSHASRGCGSACCRTSGSRGLSVASCRKA